MMSSNTQQPAVMDPEQALQELVAGNRRYSLGAGIHPNQTLNRRDQIEAGQHPFAVIIGCSDSRVPPEIIFDCGLGDLFVVRSAGNVLDTAGLASVQYAVEHLGVGLILVLGHNDCGVVKAAMAGMQSQGPLGALLANIQPAIAAASSTRETPDYAATVNIQQTMLELKKQEWIRKSKIVGGFYNLKSGLVTLNPGF